MNLKEKRETAIGAARHQLRILDCDFTIANAEEVLDEMAFVNPNLVASQWWLTASDNQWKLFCREWKRA